MTPGLAGGPPFPPRAKKGSPVAIASIEKPSVPVAVGSCLIDVSALETVQGAKGHAVQSMHWAGDEIWGYSTSGKPGVSAPEELPGWLEDGVDVKDLANETAGLDINDDDDREEGGVSLGGPETAHGREQPGTAPDDDQSTAQHEEESDKPSVPKMSTKGELDISSTHSRISY